MSYRKRFGLTGHPLPKGALGKTFFEDRSDYQRLRRAFALLADEAGLGVLTADAGVGKTAAIRSLATALPRPDHLVIYLCDTAVAPLDLYRTLAGELGVTPSHRRAQLWTDIKKALVHMVDERGIKPLVIVDEAQHLSDRFLIDLTGFLNFAIDSRDLLGFWLVGLTGLRTKLKMQQHAPLAMRVTAHVHLDALDRDTFLAFIDHALRAVGATSKLLSDPALELLFRHSRGVPRQVSRLLRAALRLAHDADQSFVDEHVLEAAIDELALVLAA